MLKQGLLTTLITLLFAMTPAMADHHKMDGDSHKGAEHPAHEMGEEVESKDYKNESDMSEDYKHNKQEADDTENAPHPAHKMGEGEEELDERGQE